MTAAPSLTGTDADDGPALDLPQSVAVLPEPADPTVQIAASTGQEAGVMEGVNAFAGSVPQLPSNPEAAVPLPVVVASAAAGEALVRPAVYVEPVATPVRGEIDRLIAKYALLYEVPEDLVRRVVHRESTFNPRAYSKGHWGLMQIKHATARGMGYQGPADGLLDADTNLKYAVKYLRGAWLVSEGNADHADKLYQRGYYYDAKRKGLLEETGLGIDRKRRRAKDEPAA